MRGNGLRANRPNYFISLLLSPLRLHQLLQHIDGKPHQMELVKANTDAAIGVNVGGIGSVFRNHPGSPLLVFTKGMVGVFSPVVMETLAIWKIVEKAIGLNVPRLVVEPDCNVAIQALISAKKEDSQIGQLVEDVKFLSTGFESFAAVYVRRQHNEAVHLLAKPGLSPFGRLFSE